MLNIVIKTVESDSAHRMYSTCGDWYISEDDGILYITVTDMNNVDAEIAVAIHELIEARACEKQGVTDLQVCQFDTAFEAERVSGKHSETEEPGDDPRSPYREPHQRATHVERAACHALDLSWTDHCGAVETFTL